MSGEMQPARPDPTMRIGHAEREQVAQLLRDAAADGRIDLNELDERLDATYAARTGADLVPITADLVAPRQSSPALLSGALPAQRSSGGVVEGPESSSHLAIMGGFDRRGAWVVPKTMNVFALMGGADLDMRFADFAAQEVVINANAIMGGVDITVGPGVEVLVEGIGILGGFDGPRVDDPTPATRRLRVKGIALMGGVSVKRRFPDESGRWRRRLPG